MLLQAGAARLSTGAQGGPELPPSQTTIVASTTPGHGTSSHDCWPMAYRT